MAKNNHFHKVTETIVKIGDSLLTLLPGEDVKVSCTEFASLTAVRTAISRRNQDVGFQEFVVNSPDNGATLCIHRYEKP